MSRRGLRALAPGLVLGALACSGQAQDGQHSGGPSATPTLGIPTAATQASAAPPPASAPSPAASAAPRAEREAAVMDLMRGKGAVTALPVDATEPGAALDESLRDQLSPRLGPPKVKMGATSVNGRLPPEVIQRIVRQNFGRFRICYEEGLKRDPALKGTVKVSFTIDQRGVVGGVATLGSDLPDAAVVGCVGKAFDNLSFPEPEGGVVQVTYPILFEPGG